MKHAHFVASALCAAALGCAPAGADARASARPTLERLAGQIEDSLWWVHLGASSAATACFGPELLDDSGRRMRLWTVNCVRPGTPAPLGCLQGVVPSDSLDPVRLDGGSWALELRPRAGLTWGAVRAQTDVDASVRGID